MVLRFFIFLFCFAFFSNSSAQINGIIYDAEVNSPLQGATITYGNNLKVSGADGKFNIIPTNETFLIISHLGYQTDTVQITDKVSDIVVYLIPDYTHLEQVTVHGPLLQNSMLNLPSSVSIMHSTDLLQSTGISYVEQLNQLSGVFVHNGTLNTNRITIRGIGSRTPYGTNRVKAYFNKIPITSGDGTVSMEDIDPSMINTIEIIKGSKSAVYGSGLGGIILLSGKEYLESGLHGKVGFEGGSFGSLNPQLNLQYKKGKFSTSASYSYAQNDGWRQNSSYKRQNLNFYSSLNTRKAKTDVLLHLIDLKAFIPSSLNEQTFLENPKNAAANWLAVKGFEEYQKVLTGIRNDLKISEKLRSKTILYLNYSNGYESRPFNMLDDDAIQTGLKNSIIYSTNKWRFRAGIELLFENYNWKILETIDGTEGELLSSYSEKRNPLNLFLYGSYTFSGGGTIETGVSYNLLNYQITDNFPGLVNHSGNFKYLPVLSPFLGINIPLNEQLRFYASAGHGFSYPTVEETLLPDGQANPDLKPESGVTTELGIRLTTFNGNLFFDAGGYFMLVEDLLVTERISEDIFTGKNAGKTRHMGFEFQTVLHLNKNQQFYLPETKLNLSLTLSNNQFTDFMDDGTDYSGNFLPGIPENTIYAGLTFNYKMGIYTHIKYSYTGKQYLNDGNEGTYSAYSLTHLKFGYRLKTKKLKPDFYFGIQNLFNEHYASMILVNAPSFGGRAPRYYYPGQIRSL